MTQAMHIYEIGLFLVCFPAGVALLERRDSRRKQLKPVENMIRQHKLEEDQIRHSTEANAPVVNSDTEEHSYRSAERRYWTTQNCIAGVALILSGIAAVGGIFSAIMAFKAVGEGRRAADESHRQADVAETTLNGIERPHLIMTEVKGEVLYICRYQYEINMGVPRCPEAPSSDKVHYTQRVQMRISFKIHNFGHTPARVINAAIHACALENILDPPVYYVDRFFKSKNLWIEAGHEIQETRLADIENGDVDNARIEHPEIFTPDGRQGMFDAAPLFFFIWGVVEYEDVTGRIARRGFASKFPGLYNAPEQAGGYAYNYEYIEKTDDDRLSLRPRKFWPNDPDGSLARCL